MSENGYKLLGFVVWKGGSWYLRRRYGLAKRVSAGVVAAAMVAAAGAAVLAQRRNGNGR